jgi:hypothetical protein
MGLADGKEVSWAACVVDAVSAVMQGGTAAIESTPAAIESTTVARAWSAGCRLAEKHVCGISLSSSPPIEKGCRIGSPFCFFTL